jgi:hypothetical protein
LKHPNQLKNDRTSEISILKGQIGSILKKQRISEAEQGKAKFLIKQLNIKVGDLIKAVGKYFLVA